MLTLFTIPKPFRGHVGVIQRNAVESWARLRPACQIILFGDEDGTRGVAKECGTYHMPEVSRNEFGTPLLDSAFAAAERIGTSDLLCYVNADIIMMRDFITAATRLAGWKRRFLMIGQRWDVDIDWPWDFDQRGWEEQLRSYVKSHGILHPPTGADYFVFPRGLWQTLPPFAVGRVAWDNWMIFKARSLGAPVIDATACVTAIHQNHGYSHFPAGDPGVLDAPEASRNLELAGGYRHVFTLDDATHVLTPRGLRQDLRLPRIRRHLQTLPVLAPRLHALARLARPVVRLAIRHARKSGLIADA